MIAKEQNIALLTVGNEALKNVDWKDYANYCFDREKGFRKLAFIHLDNFIKSTETWNLVKKIDFVKFLFPFFEILPEADYGPFPQPLSDKLIKPTLEIWCEIEKNDNNPFRWYGKYYGSEYHLFKAIEINKEDDIARQILLRRWTNNINYSVHHLPEGYLGDPFEDLKLGDKIKEQISQLSTSKNRENWSREIEHELELVKNYVDWKISKHHDFSSWGKENNRQTSYKWKAN